MTALGDFSSGDVLTAADLNAVGATTAYTPTVTAQTGTITTSTVLYSKYVRINELVIYTVRVEIVNAGTGSGYLAVTLPVAPSKLPEFTCFGRETQVTGDQLSGELFSSPAKLAIFYYDGSGIVATNRKISATTIYEAA